MQQSEMLDLGAGFLSVDLGTAAGTFGAASALRWRNALVLTCNVLSGNYRYPTNKKRERNFHLLECICGCLPLAAYLNTNTDAFVYVFGTTLIVDTELESVAVLKLEWARVLRGSREANVIEKCARAALGILDVKFAAKFAPDFGMGTGDDL